VSKTEVLLGTLERAIARTARLLDKDPVLAEEQALEILEAVPNHPPSVFHLAIARRLAGNPSGALEVLEPLLNAQHQWGAAFYEHGLVLAMLGRGEDAIKSLYKAVELQPDHPEAWRTLGDHLVATGEAEKADVAYARHVQCSVQVPEMQEAAIAMVRNNVPVAERKLKKHLMQKPTDVAAIRMLAEVAVRCDRDDQAEVLLQRCIELAPSFTAARFNYALLLQRKNNAPAALREIERCMEVEPERPNFRNLYAVILGAVGEYDRASETYARLLDEYPSNAKVWQSYGHVLKTRGRPDECIAAYRKSISLDPSFGDAYWSLANLKTFRFTKADLAEMDKQIADPELSDENRWHFHFALGKAFEDANNYQMSFDHYEKANDLVRANHGYDADVTTGRAKAMQENFSQSLYAERPNVGCEAPDPIFIVGMPRAGSTLLEQILSCHSMVEGTIELPDMINISRELRREAIAADFKTHGELLATKSDTELQALGEDYIERTQIHRKTDRPFFIDKMPNNFMHVGMIQLFLPNAKIIDARRHPLGCCFSNLKQYYASGQFFSYNQTELGRFYFDYVRLMAHFDTVLPGRVHRVFYEDTVNDAETVIRGMLDYCGLPFEEECLNFFENQRPVRTASSEQVRQPIYRDGMEQWQHFEQWLDPLKKALGEVLEAYPSVPSL